MKSRTIALALLASLLIVGCSISGESRGYREISPQELSELDPDEVFLVDTNTQVGEQLPNTDMHIPANLTEQRQGRYPPDRDALIVVYCTGGPLSARAARDLVELGYTNVAHLTGGINAWKKAGLPVE